MSITKVIILGLVLIGVSFYIVKYYLKKKDLQNKCRLKGKAEIKI